MRKIGVLIVGLCLASCAQAKVLHVVAAENFYADIATTLGQPYVEVTSVLNQPADDPHLFAPSPAIAEQVERADILIENGAGYDSWMDALYTAGKKQTTLIKVSDLTHTSARDNPHIWYAPATMPLLAKRYTDVLIALDPQHKSTYFANYRSFQQQSNLYQFQINTLKNQVQGLNASATEPVADALLLALGFNILNQAFAWTIMNGGNVSPAEVMHFEHHLTAHKTQLLVVNQAVTSPLISHLVAVAEAQHIPVVRVTELMPEGSHYYPWMLSILAQIKHGLGAK